MKQIKWVLQALCFMLVGILCTYSIVLSINAKKYPDKPPSAFGVSGLYILTGSMEPAISQDDYILVKEVLIEDIEVGDIITFYYGNDRSLVVTHRVIDITKVDDVIQLTTQGDANNIEDEFVVTQEALIGKHFFTIPQLGKLRKGLSLNIIIPLGCVGLGAYLLLKGNKREETEKK